MECRFLLIWILYLPQVTTSTAQDCLSKRQALSSLHQIQKLLSGQEASYLQSLRTMKKKISLLQNTITRQVSKLNETCPKLEVPNNGRKLGSISAVGHEVHFLCEKGFELVGSETRVCQESHSWSGQQPFCRNINECAKSPCLNGGTCVDDVNRFVCMCALCSLLSTDWTSQTNSSFSRQPHCANMQGSTQCTCDEGFQIAGRDNSLCQGPGLATSGLNNVMSLDCLSKRQALSSLHQIQKLLSGQEASYLQSLRTMKKKISLLQNTITRQVSKLNETCPKLEVPNNGRKLGSISAVGHEVHFLCEKGFELVGSETRVCQESHSWSGQQPFCRNINECAKSPCLNGGTCVDDVNRFACMCARGWSGTYCQNSVYSYWTSQTNSSFSRQPHCANMQGSTQCTCDEGFQIAGRDNSLCQDLDECELYYSGRLPRLCAHACVNTPGSYRCTCPPGYSLRGDQRNCKDLDECASRQHNCSRDELCVNTFGGFQCVRPDCPRARQNTNYVKTSLLGWSGTYCQNSVYSYWTSQTNSSFSRQPHCANMQGSTQCTCDEGFQIAGRDNSLCQDLDECELYYSGRLPRLCAHACVNTPGSYRCTCPPGYSLRGDQRNCKDLDECASRQHNCSHDELCVNTFGGFQCVRPDCPRARQNTNYVKTSLLRCERNPCPVDNKACAQAASSISFSYLSLVSNLTVPRVLFRMSAARVHGDSLRFGLLGGRGRGHFSVQRSDRLTGELVLVSPVLGPAVLEAELEMTELEKRTVLARFISKVTVFISQYDF
ncbi:UNVERIFIED_CONTAM: hypothetical protein FKN15_046987 [Acipenser sinensis]